MTPCRHLAFIPIGNAGQDTISEFVFACGAKLRLGRPREIWDMLPEFQSVDWLSGSEMRCFNLARGWLWLASNEEVEYDFATDRNPITITTRLATRLWSIRQLIDLAGGGENSYWRSGANMHCAGVYLNSIDFPLTPPIRKHFIYNGVCSHRREARWSEDVLALADRLEQANREADGPSVPRLALAAQLLDTITAMDVRRLAIRFQLAVTALETFYVAPGERKYIWDDEVIARVREVCEREAGVASACPHAPPVDDAFFTEIQSRRHDAVHRAGLTADLRRERTVEFQGRTEDLLRQSIRWGIANRRLIAGAFARDEWPQMPQETNDMTPS